MSKPVWSRYGRRKPMTRKDIAPPPNTYGLPKGEFTRRLAGVGCSYRDDEATIKQALKIVEAFLAWVRRLSCCNCGARQLVEPHHVGSRGARNPDFGNTAPLCHPCHKRDHAGLPLNVDLERVARERSVEYLALHPDAADFLAAHSTDAAILDLVAPSSGHPQHERLNR